LVTGNKITQVIIISTTSNLRRKKADVEVIVKYIKNNLYPKIGFFYKAKEDLMVGGPIYDDFKDSCVGQIGDHNMTDETWATYIMETAWNAGLTEHV
jgi:hypothetical protein